MVEVKKIEENVTEIKFSNKQNKFHIEQLKFIGAKPIKESSRYEDKNGRSKKDRRKCN